MTALNQSDSHINSFTAVVLRRNELKMWHRLDLAYLTQPDVFSSYQQITVKNRNTW
jgi:hypothetical protein